MSFEIYSRRKDLILLPFGQATVRMGDIVDRIRVWLPNESHLLGVDLGEAEITYQG
jgi:hypothetical protein